MQRRKYLEFGIILLLVSASGNALAQDEAAEPAADASATASFGTEGASAGSSAKSGKTEFDPFEVGLYGGLMFLGNRSNTDIDNLGSVGFDWGLRLGGYPIRYVGIEGEFGFVQTRTDSGVGANMGTARFHLVGQYPMERLTPFLVVGGGILGGECPPEGCDSVLSGREAPAQFHFGLGVKVPIVDHFHARFDARDNVVPRNGEEGTADHLPDVLVSLAYTFGGKPAPTPPSDRDGDGLTDTEDACPDEPASTPDGCPIRDRDGDGVPDDIDECPDEPSDRPNGCPDPDPDGDGILGDLDKCPDVPGIEPDGCPDTDLDKDGIPNDEDKCPEEPETRNGFEDADGCPDEVPEEVKKFTGAIEGITFELGSAKIKASSHGVLDQAVELLNMYPSLRLRVSGHTDDVGDDESNQKLSEERAQSVAEYFKEKGVSEDRLETIGHGESKPVEDNATAAGRKKNRRIEFEVIQN